MEFHIAATGMRPDLSAIEAAITMEDPAALVDLDPAGTLRIATMLGAGELLALVNKAGCAVSPQQLRQLPSICCGGCSG